MDRSAPLSPLEHFTTLLGEELRQLSASSNPEESDSTCRAVNLLKDIEPPPEVLLELVAQAYHILAKSNDGIGITPTVFNEFVAEMLQDAPAFVQLHLVAFLQRGESNLRFFVPFNELVIAVNVCLVVRKLLRDLENTFNTLCALDASAQRLTLEAALDFFRTENWAALNHTNNYTGQDPFATEQTLQEHLAAIGPSFSSEEDFDNMVEDLVISQNVKSAAASLNITGPTSPQGPCAEQNVLNAEKAIRMSAAQNKGCIPLADFQRVVCLHLTPLNAILRATSTPKTTLNIT